MKQETNNEMDLLLRRLGRRHDASASPAGDHLDADELSAYAENALPVAARVRYSEHLAECLRCRELVVQLSSAAGVVVAHDTVKVAAPSFLKKLLASFFSPMVLRYAAPALGLIVVAVIGLVVLRRDRAGEFSARVQPDSPAQVPVPPGSKNDQNNYGYTAPQKAYSTGDARTNKQPEHDKAAEPAPAPNNAPVVTVDATVSPEATDQKAKQSSANGAPAKEAPKPASSPTEEKQQEAVAVQARRDSLESPTPTIQQSVDKAPRLREQEREVAARAADRDTRPATKRATTANAAPAAGSGSVAKLGEANVDKTEKDSAETRSVAGRRFRKERGIWIDTAYDSRGTTTLTRGSEQYRALVADEPEIKTIADQLEGEIIVVWKGRAYRIR